MTSAMLPYRYPELLWVLYDIHTRTLAYPELLYVMYARGTIPGVRVRPCKYPGTGTGTGTGTEFVYLPRTSVS